MTRLLLRAVSPAGVSTIMRSAALPSYATLKSIGRLRDLPLLVILLNFAATALWTIGVLASIYAAVITPELRVTAASLSSLINGAATILMFVAVDPHLSAVTDDSASGRIGESYLRRFIIWMIASRLAGTLAAQFLFYPAASVVAWTAQAL